MKIIFIFFSLFIAILTVQGPPPPVWPETFSQDFVQGDNKTRIYESGKIFYDYSNDRQRIDASGSNFQPLCYKLTPEPRTRCTLIYVNGAQYIYLPQKSICCKCCTKTQGCFIQSRNWLQNFVYAGEATLSGATFYKWTQSSSGLNYYATEDQGRIPRRIDGGSFALDFIMNTYTTETINDSVFSLPSNCTSRCPATSGCLSGFEENEQPKTIESSSFWQKRSHQSDKLNE